IMLVESFISKSPSASVLHLGAGVTLVVGVLAGVLSGLLGVGGGIILVPAMVLLLGVPQKLAQGISLTVILPISLSGADMHARHGNVSFPVGFWLGIGGVAGGLFGAQLAIGMAEAVLTGLFGLLMLVMGSFMAYSRRENR
ncbi:MAG: TSUP family transporter, partial [Armatimonadota bacterium]